MQSLFEQLKIEKVYELLFFKHLCGKDTVECG